MLLYPTVEVAEVLPVPIGAEGEVNCGLEDDMLVYTPPVEDGGGAPVPVPVPYGEEEDELVQTPVSDEDPEGYPPVPVAPPDGADRDSGLPDEIAVAPVDKGTLPVPVPGNEGVVEVPLP